MLNLANGGTGGLLAATIVACVFMSFVYISLAEKIRKCATRFPPSFPSLLTPQKGIPQQEGNITGSRP